MNYCLECDKEIVGSEAAYCCSAECYQKTQKRELKEVLGDGLLDLKLSLNTMQQDIKDLIQDIEETL